MSTTVSSINGEYNRFRYIGDASAFGARLQSARRAAGLSQRQLAADLCSVSYIARIEAGQRRPSLQLLREFAHRLHMTEEELVEAPNGAALDSAGSDRARSSSPCCAGNCLPRVTTRGRQLRLFRVLLDALVELVDRTEGQLADERMPVPVVPPPVGQGGPRSATDS